MPNLQPIHTHEPRTLLPVRPETRGLDVTVRRAVPACDQDFKFVDRLQKAESDKVGFMWEKALRKRIDDGDLFIAEVAEDGKLFRGGYCLGVDRYMKQDHVGIIYQMAVLPEYRRSLVAASLLQARFDHSAYGTKLYCCWCKQSLEANRFWQAMGFVPLAFRASGRSNHNGRKKSKNGDSVHIFWQKRIRQGDAETPYWYPYETSGGSMMEGRVVLPLPPEVDWDQATPIVLPGAEQRAAETRQLEHKVAEIDAELKAAKKRQNRRDTGTAQVPNQPPAHAPRAVATPSFGVSLTDEPETAKPNTPEPRAVEPAETKRLRDQQAAAKAELKAAQRKNDPELVAYARELRDRWQEHVTASPQMLEHKYMPRYQISRLLGGHEPDQDGLPHTQIEALPKRRPHAA
ncbi:MAG: GNAT family N-acetyltransferase [Planctomycetota bacterium]